MRDMLARNPLGGPVLALALLVAGCAGSPGRLVAAEWIPPASLDPAADAVWARRGPVIAGTGTAGASGGLPSLTEAIVAMRDPVERAPEFDPSRDPALVFDDTIITISARTVDFNGQGIIARYMHARRGGGGRQLDVDEFRVRSVFGVDQDTTVSLTLPVVQKRLLDTRLPPGPGSRIETSGLGDILLLGKHQFYKQLDPGKATVFSGLLGMELPTGSTWERASGRRAPRPLQPGSGSWDLLAGAAFTHVDGRWLVNADALFKWNSRADGFQFGRELRLDVGVQYRVSPAKYESFDETTVNLLAEFNARYAGRNEVRGMSVTDSGGWRVFFTPGIQVIANDSLLFEGAVLVPIFQDLDGVQLEDDFAIVLGLRALF